VTNDRLYPARPILAASVAVIRDGRILLATRGKPPSEGLFSLPGGMVDVGETLAEAALRELREEVGVEARMIGLIAPVEFIERDDKGHIKHHVVIAAHAARCRSPWPCVRPPDCDRSRRQYAGARATAAVALPVAITATRRATRSAASAGRRSS